MADIQKLQLKREKQQMLREEKRKQQMDQARREEQASENRKEWVHKKLFEIEKERREKVTQLEYEKLKVNNFILLLITVQTGRQTV